MIRVDTAAVQPYETQHMERLRALAPECMVLLKKDGAFPISPCAIAAYGSGVRHTIKGGTGSGDVNVRNFLNIEQSLSQAGFSVVSTAWLDAYDQVLLSHQQAYRAAHASQEELLLSGAVPEPEYELPTVDTFDTAIYVLSRISGEGADRRPVSGDFELTGTEIRDIRRIAAAHRRFMLVLNVGGPVNVKPVMDVPNILLLSQLGSITSEAFCDVLTGKASPSGRLTATWAELADYSTTDGFGDPNDTVYREGVYVGYRWFETFEKKLLFPFGFGLSYTSFRVAPLSCKKEQEDLIAQVSVRNTGNRSGSDVIQLWVSRVGEGLDCPARELAAFSRTALLNPGAEETVSLRLPVASLAAFDPASHQEVLFGGTYRLLVSDGSEEAQTLADVVIDQDRILRQLTPLQGLPEAACLHAPSHRREWAANRRIIEVSAKEIACAAPDEMPIKLSPEKKSLLQTLTDRQLAQLCLGDYRENAGSLLEIIGNASSSVAGAAGQTCGRLREKGIRPIIMADGPAGLRLSRRYQLKDGDAVSLESSFTSEGTTDQQSVSEKGPVYYQYCTAIPIGTAIAQSWDTGLASACGEVVGEEMERFGIDIWLAPALNIQRSPLCGRNFEYFSEDPLISGAMAAAIVKGVESVPGRMTTIKHLACNNQETNRFFSNSQVSARALREIYLKGFEYCIREAKPSALMTSYNLLNGEHTCNRKDLLVDVLRHEWGYNGLVMTDWLVTGGAGARGEKHPCASAAGCVKVENDLIMPGMASDLEDILRALSDSAHPYSLTREHLLACAERLLQTLERLDQTN